MPAADKHKKHKHCGGSRCNYTPSKRHTPLATPSLESSGSYGTRHEAVEDIADAKKMEREEKKDNWLLEERYY